MKSSFAALWIGMLSVCAVGAGCNSARAARDAEHDAGYSQYSAKPQAASAPVAEAATQPFVFDPKQTLSTLASDEFEGRGIGTAGLDRAAELVATDFAKVGLKPLPGLDGYFQPFEMTTATEIGPATALRSGERSFEPKEAFSPVSFSAEGKFAGPVVFVGYAIKNSAQKYDDFAGVDLKEKVALAMRFEPHDAAGKSRFEKDGWSDAAALGAKAKAASDAGAVALLLVTPAEFHGDEDRLVPFSRWPMSDKPTIPVIHVRQTVAQELLKRGGGPELKELQVKIDSSAKPASFALAGVEVAGDVELKRSKATVKNVVGLLPGKIADEYVVIGGHYDHLGHGGAGSLNPRSHEIHHGADDNASGTTAMLELAAKLARGAAKGEGPDRSIIFIAFTAEEEGLIGSARFVEHPPVPLERMTAMINLDMVGRVRSTPSSTNIGAPPTSLPATSGPTTQIGEGILYVGGSGTAATFDAIIDKADERSPLALKNIGKGGLGPSDHMSFALKKVPVLFFFSGLHADYHRPTDTADKINYAGIDEVVDLVADVVDQIAQSPRQAYVTSADAHSMHIGSSGSGGATVTLGVVPDYTAAMDVGGGVKISGTSPESPAAKAGLKAGDVIVKWDEKIIDTLYDLSDMLAKGKPGQKVQLKVMRDGKPVEMQATLAARG